MMRVWKQVLILILVFFAGLIVFDRMTNHEVVDVTTDLAEATLPVVYLVEESEKINELHGYTTEMNATSMRDTITPVESGGELSVYVESFGETVTAVSYEIWSLDLSRLVQQTDVENLSVSEECATADLPIRDLLTEGEEYVLILQVTTSGDPCYFYTRIIEENDSNITSCIAFVKEFHAITMDKERKSELASYMETEAGADNTTLQTVTINNSLSQACWGDLEGVEVTEPSVSVKELNDTYNVIVLTYLFSSEDEDGNASYYNVEEYYRVRQGEQKVYLLSFERTVEEIFCGTEGQVSESALILGIRSSDVDYISNSSNSVICFVQQGELWSYNTGTNTLTQVYAFRTLGETDIRENYNEHDIRIIRTDESGNVDFIVYGYMNRGDHEGQVGISVCYYESATATVEEKLFIPSTDSYQIMKEELGQLMYISDDGVFYLLMGSQVHAIDLDTLQEEVLLSEVTEETCVSSEDGRYFAWTTGSMYEADTLYITDLETETTTAITAEQTAYICPLGFLETDCVYGMADAAMVSEEDAVFAMNRLVIVDASASVTDVLKTYETAAGTYITGVSVSDGNIYLTRAVNQNGVYTETDGDVIYNRDMQTTAAVYVAEKTDAVKQRLVQLCLAKSVSGACSVITPKLMVKETDVTLSLTGSETGSAYYVYAKGKVMLGTDRLSEAILCADEHRGVVIGENQTYVWKRAKKAQQSLSKTSIADDGDGYRLTGISLEQALYFVGEGVPVKGLLDGESVWVIGYDSVYVSIYHASTETTETMTITAAAEAFEQSGNVFFVAQLLP